MTNRIPPVDAVHATPEQAVAIERFLAHRKGVETSPANLYGMLLASPGTADALSELGAACRFRNAVPKDALEVAILTTLTELGFEYEMGPHEAYASSLGLGRAALTAIRERRPENLPSHLKVASTTATALVRGNPVPQATFDSALEAWGARGVVDLTVTVGYYSLLALAGRMLTPDPDRGHMPSTVPAPPA